MGSGGSGALRRFGMPLAIVLGVMLFALLGWLLWVKLQAKSDGPPKPPKISLIPVAPPPPPPPPPKEEKRPEPPKEQQDMKAPQPVEQKAPAPAPSPDLKMEGAAGDGPSAFSSGRVTNENQIPATKGGGGGGGGGVAIEVKPERPVEPPKPEPKIEAPKPRNPLEKSGLFNPLANYARVLKLEAQKHFNQTRALRQRPYRVEVLLWIAEDGRPTRAELVAGSGDEEIDGLLREALATLPRFTEMPPAEIQLPIRLAITASGRN